MLWHGLGMYTYVLKIRMKTWLRNYLTIQLFIKSFNNCSLHSTTIVIELALTNHSLKAPTLPTLVLHKQSICCDSCQSCFRDNSRAESDFISISVWTETHNWVSQLPWMGDMKKVKLSLLTFWLNFQLSQFNLLESNSMQIYALKSRWKPCTTWNNFIWKCRRVGGEEERRKKRYQNILWQNYVVWFMLQMFTHFHSCHTFSVQDKSIPKKVRKAMMPRQKGISKVTALNFSFAIEAPRNSNKIFSETPKGIFSASWEGWKSTEWELELDG